MPLTLPSGRVVDIDPLTGGDGRPTNYTPDHPAGWTPAYGAAPQVPDYISSMWEALGGDLSALPNLFSLGNAYNLFNYDQRMGQVQGTPGFSSVLSNLAGQLPQDVVNQLAQRGAERGVSTGAAPDSPNLNAAYLRSIGLNSLDQQKLGQQQLGSLLSQFKQADPFDIMQFLAKPDDIQAARVAANVNAGAPDPKAAADEAQRKLLEAIEAGKRAAGPGAVTPPGVDWTKLLELINKDKDKGPGTVVAPGPNKTIDRGNDFFVPSPIKYPNATRPDYVDPGVSGTIPGRPDDVIQNAFKTPLYSNVGTQGGIGLNPALNAVLANIGKTGIQNGGGPTIENANLIPDDWSSLSGLNDQDFYNTLFGFGDTGAPDIYDTLGGASDQDFFSNIFGFGDNRDIYDTLGGASDQDFFSNIFGFGDTGNDFFYEPDMWDWGGGSNDFGFNDYYNPA